MACHYSTLLFTTLASTILLVSSMNNATIQPPSQFKVGNTFGWQQPPLDNTEFYTQWAANYTFQVSDTLVFEYKNDSVVSVDRWDFFHCDASNPITFFNDGNNTITLNQPGSFYFISGLYEHCRNGQRLMVEVKSPFASAPSPSHRHRSSASSPSLSLLLLFITACFSFIFFIIALGV